MPICTTWHNHFRVDHPWAQKYYKEVFLILVVAMICIIATSKGTCNSHHCSELDILVLLQNHTVLRTTHEGRLRLHVNCAMTNMTYNENYWLRHKWVKVVLYVKLWTLDCGWLQDCLMLLIVHIGFSRFQSYIYCLHDIFEPTCAFCTVGSYASLSVCPSGFVRPTLCTTSWVQNYVVHQQPALCTGT